MKKLSFNIIYIFFIYLLIELVLRAGIHFTKDYPFWQPRDTFKKNFIESKNIQTSPDKFDILILGGSAISDDLPAKIGEQLSAKFKKSNQNIQVYNLGTPAHNSRDNLLKMRELHNEKFDLIVYYESINDVRYNNIQKEFFQEDYSHSYWYEELKLMEKHPEMNWTVVPFVFELFKERAKENSGKKVMLNGGLDIKKELLQYGKDIKTDVSFRKNLEEIIQIANTNKIPVLLLGYSIYIPEEIYKRENFDFHKEGKFFKSKGPRTVVGAWGYPENIDKTVKIHNEILVDLSKKYSNVNYYDTNPTMVNLHDYYFDICHFTKEGGAVFADTLGNVILRKYNVKDSK
jgi:hypothetical protein